jgi:hypothetical protein
MNHSKSEMRVTSSEERKSAIDNKSSTGNPASVFGVETSECAGSIGGHKAGITLSRQPGGRCSDDGADRWHDKSFDVVQSRD